MSLPSSFSKTTNLSHSFLAKKSSLSQALWLTAFDRYKTTFKTPTLCKAASANAHFEILQFVQKESEKLESPEGATIYTPSGSQKTSQTWEDRFGDWLCNPLSGIKICTKSFAASCKMKTSPFEASSHCHWPSVNKWSLTFDPHSRRLCVTMWLWVAASDSDSLQLSAPWDALRGRFSSWNQPSCRPGPWGCYLKGDRWCSAQNELVGNQNNRSVMLGSWQWTQLARFWFNLGRSRKNNVRVQRQPRIGHEWLALAHLPKHV